MKLIKYKVTNFRSIEDSGWIECENVTTLVGINESGKTNLLLALWKLNPAREGEIDLLHDMPVSKLSVMRENIDKECFITAVFQIDSQSVDNISSKTGYVFEEGTEITLKRFYNGQYNVQYSSEPVTINIVGKTMTTSHVFTRAYYLSYNESSNWTDVHHLGTTRP